MKPPYLRDTIVFEGGPWDGKEAYGNVLPTHFTKENSPAGYAPVRWVAETTIVYGYFDPLPADLESVWEPGDAAENIDG